MGSCVHIFHEQKIPLLLAGMLIEKTFETIDRNDDGGPWFQRKAAGVRTLLSNLVIECLNRPQCPMKDY
jgi:hypothetical protein